MTIEDIISGNVGKPVSPFREDKTGNITTRYYHASKPSEWRVERVITFAGREIPLPSPFDMFRQDEAVRQPTITTSLSPVGVVQAVRQPIEGRK